MAKGKFDKWPYSCVADATKYLDTVVVRSDDGVRNTFLMKLQPFTEHCVEGGLRGSQVWLNPTDREDLGSCVWLYLLEKWYPRLRIGRRKTSTSQVAGYLAATVRGLVKEFIHALFVRISREPGEWVLEPQVTFEAEVDFRLDREEIRRTVQTSVEHYMRTCRPRTSEVREVVERMLRVLNWKRYEESGELVGVRGGDSAHSVVGVVSLGGDGA